MARPKGTTDLARAQKRVNMQDTRLITEVADIVLEAFSVIKDVMQNDKASDNIRLSAAKTVVDLHKQHVKEATRSKNGGVKDSTEVRLQKAQTTLSEQHEPMMLLTDTFSE